MMLAGITLVLAWLGVIWTGVLAILFLRDPVRGLALTTHHLEDLPKVMTGRYFALVFLALGAVLYGDFKVVAFLFAVFSFLGFADAWIYHRAGKPIAKHAAAGASGVIVTLFALLSLNTGVTA